MKFRITMKDPDGPYECIEEAAKKALGRIEGLTDEEREGLHDSRAAELRKFTYRWLEYGEYITVEFDTETGTCTVIQVVK